MGLSASTATASSRAATWYTMHAHGSSSREMLSATARGMRSANGLLSACDSSSHVGAAPAGGGVTCWRPACQRDPARQTAEFVGCPQNLHVKQNAGGTPSWDATVRKVPYSSRTSSTSCILVADSSCRAGAMHARRSSLSVACSAGDKVENAGTESAKASLRVALWGRGLSAPRPCPGCEVPKGTRLLPLGWNPRGLRPWSGRGDWPRGRLAPRPAAWWSRPCPEG